MPGIELQSSSPPEWINTVLENFDDFLLDHATCERKASATALSFVCRYRNRPKLIEAMINLAREELQHFHQVVKMVLERNLELLPDEKTPYVNKLMQCSRGNEKVELLDRLLIFGIIEARGHERFSLVGEGLPESSPHKTFYQRLARAEARHHELFLELAEDYFPQEDIPKRLQELLTKEAEILQSLPIRPAVH